MNKTFIALILFALSSASLAAAEAPVVVTNARQIVEQRLDNTPVRVVGRVRAAVRDTTNDRYNFLVLDCGDSLLYGGVSGSNRVETLRGLQRFVGCDVEVSAVARLCQKTNSRRVLAAELDDIRPDDIRILRAADRDPFDVPPLAATNAAWTSVLASGPRTVTGRVIARWNDDTMLVQPSAGAPVVVTLNIPELPALDATVEVAGLPNADLYNYSLAQADWRPTQIDAPPAPQDVLVRTIEGLIHERDRVVCSTEYGCLVRLRGVVRERSRLDNGALRLRLNDGGRYTMTVDCTAAPQAFARLEEGATVEATGVYVFQCDDWSPHNLFPKIRNLLLVTRREADLAVVARPPFWTPFRFFLAVCGFAVALFAILVWNVALRVTVARKSKALLHEQAAKLGETLKIDERTRLAAELHDNLAQNLTVVSYRISAARSAAAAKSPATDDFLAGAERMLQSCRTDLRRCLWDLRNDVLNETDFAEAIRRTIRPLAEGLDVRVRCEIPRARLNDTTAHAILCIVRELVFNAVAHGQAKTIRIAGARDGDAIRLSVSDDGAGFDPASRPTASDGHFGLDGVAERLRRYDGSLKIESCPGHGTYVAVTLNLKESAQ